MKKIILGALLFIFILLPNAISLDEEIYSYDESINVIQNLDKIPIEKNTTYYLTYCRLYEDCDYFKELENEGIQNKNLVIRTDSRNEKIMFQSEKTKFGTVYYAKIVNISDEFIYYMSFPATKEMNENREELFSFIKEEEFNNLNIHYNNMYQETFKTDFDGIYYVDCNNIVTTKEILSNIKAIDNNDGTLENITITYDEYSNKTQIGDYYMEFSIKDSSDNETSYRLLVKIVDIEAPIIYSKTHQKRIETTNKKLLSYNDLLNLVEVSDNTCDMNGRIKILENNYFRNETINGEYKVTYYAMDLYGNYSTFDIVIGVGKTQSSYTIEKYTTDNLSVKMACDEYFKSIGLNPYYEITSDNYTGYENIAGTYEIGVSYEDNGLKYSVITLNVVEPEKKEIEKVEKTNYLRFIIIGVVAFIGVVATILVIIRKKRNKTL